MFYQTSGKMMTCLLRMCGCSPLQLPRQHAGDHQMLSPVFWCVTAIKTPEALKFLTADNPHEELIQEHHIAALVQFTSSVLKKHNKKPQKRLISCQNLWLLHRTVLSSNRLQVWLTEFWMFKAMWFSRSRQNKLRLKSPLSPSSITNNPSLNPSLQTDTCGGYLCTDSTRAKRQPETGNLLVTREVLPRHCL